MRARSFPSPTQLAKEVLNDKTANRANVTGHVGRVGAVIAIVVALYALSAAAKTAKEVKGATPLVAVPNEAPAELGERTHGQILRDVNVNGDATPTDRRSS